MQVKDGFLQVGEAEKQIFNNSKNKSGFGKSKKDKFQWCLCKPPLLRLHYNDLKDEIDDLLQVVREFVVKPDYMNELLQALTNAVNTFADRGGIDYEAVNKMVDIIPIMQKLDSKDVAKSIVKEFHNDDKGLSYDVSKQPQKSNKGRKTKTEFTVEKGEKTE